MRAYGRVTDTLTGEKIWIEVRTDTRGFNDAVYLTNLAQVLKLNLGESPFYADWGIPAHASIVTQIAPDFHIALIQKRFALRFMALTLQRMADAADDLGRPAPFYAIGVTTNYGSYLPFKVPI